MQRLHTCQNCQTAWNMGRMCVCPPSSSWESNEYGGETQNNNQPQMFFQKSSLLKKYGGPDVSQKLI